MTAAPRHWTNAIWPWLALAAVLVPALGSTGSPLRPGQGSAFSAFTRDVSLGPARPTPPEKARKEQRSPGQSGDTVARLGFAQPIAPVPAPLAHRRGRETDPLPPRVLTGAAGARAPPLSRTL